VKRLGLKNRVLVEITARRSEEVLNYCAQRGISVYSAAVSGEGTLRMQVRPEGYRDLREHTPGWMTVEAIGKSCAGRAAGVLLERKRLLVMLLLVICAVWFSSLFIWEVEVYGNETVSTARILRELETYGVKVGGFRLGVDQAHITHGMLLSVTELSWITVNTRGSRLTVLVREETPAPEIHGKQPEEIVAARGGILERVTPLEGFACVRVGDVVEAGTLLISSEAESQFGGRRELAAMGEVLARTNRELTAAVPLDGRQMRLTGRSSGRFALKFGANRLNLYFDSGNPYTECVKIREEFPLRLPGTGKLPVSVIRETFEEYTAEMPADVSGTEAVLREVLRLRLEEVLPEGSEILREEYRAEEKDGALFVMLQAECLEDIAAVRTTGTGNQSPEE